MATVKSYTDIEQSKKLAEILPLETADMFYDGVQDLYKEKVYNIPINGSSISVRTRHTFTKKAIKANLLLPCWSLAALLGVLYDAHLKKYVYGGITKYYVTLLGNRQYNSMHHDNPVDACYEAIMKLQELN